MANKKATNTAKTTEGANSPSVVDVVPEVIDKPVAKISDDHLFHFKREGTLVAAPIKRIRKGTPVSHETSFKFQDAKDAFGLSFTGIGGFKRYVNPFKSKEEQAWLEDQLGVSLNVNSFPNKFLSKFRVKLGNGTLSFDMSNPQDYLAAIILGANKDAICVDPKQRLMKGTYKYVLSREGFQEAEREELADRKVALFAFFNQISNSREKLLQFLRLREQRPAPNASLAWLKTKVFEEIEANPTQCYILINDEDREIKGLFDEALMTNAVIYIEGEGYAVAGSATPFAASKSNAILFLKDKRNQDTLVRIKGLITANSK